MHPTATITERLLTGPAVAAHLEALASLRLEIFQEFPYLYRADSGDIILNSKATIRSPLNFIGEKKLGTPFLNAQAKTDSETDAPTDSSSPPPPAPLPHRPSPNDLE